MRLYQYIRCRLLQIGQGSSKSSRAWSGKRFRETSANMHAKKTFKTDRATLNATSSRGLYVCHRQMTRSLKSTTRSGSIVPLGSNCLYMLVAQSWST